MQGLGKDMRIFLLGRMLVLLSLRAYTYILSQTGRMVSANLSTYSLPILIQPPFIRQAIQAGKHVLSEKPIAKDVATALDLLRWYHERARTAPGDRKILWAVGENIRYQDKFEAAAKVMGTLGSLKRFRVSVHGMVTRESKYYSE